MNKKIIDSKEKIIREYFKDRIEHTTTNMFIRNLSSLEYDNLPFEIRQYCFSKSYFPKYNCKSPLIEICKDKEDHFYIKLKNENEVSTFIRQLIGFINSKEMSFRQMEHTVTSLMQSNTDVVFKKHVEEVWELCLEWRKQFD